MKGRHTVVDNHIEERYEMEVGGDKVYIDYIKEPRRIRLTHTCVPAHLAGRGVGSELVAGALEDAREKGLQVVPECSFVAHYIARHPEWAQIVCREA
ncbi:GNAT family N-acetyltransferase [Alistipes sp.]|uniref:GNAT family N-acetyltransferase n=1 Tax=Alistipes sp. TaxID=1872444 RepID=UPI003AF17248